MQGNSWIPVRRGRSGGVDTSIIVIRGLKRTVGVFYMGRRGGVGWKRFLRFTERILGEGDD